MMEGLTGKSVAAVMAVSEAAQSSALDRLLETVLDELLGAVDDAALGWIYLCQEPDGNPTWPSIVLAPGRTTHLAAVRHAAELRPRESDLVRPDCACLRALAGGDPAPLCGVIDGCPQPALSGAPGNTHACVPLVARGRAIGVLNLAKHRSASFSPNETLLLQTVSRQFNIALENSRLMRETQARLRETQTLLEVSHSVNSTLNLQEAVRRVARAVARVLGADTAGAYLLDADGEHLVPFAGYRLPKGLLQAFTFTPIPVKGFRFVEEAFRTRMAVYTSDTDQDSRVDHRVFRSFSHKSALFVPMLAKDRIIGGLFVIWWKRERHFTKEEVGLVDAIATQAAIAIENAKLFEEVQTHVQAVQASEERYRLLAEQVRDVIYALDHEGRFTYLNPRVEEMLGYRIRELIGRDSTDILTPESRRVAQEIFAGVAGGHDVFNLYELDMVRKDGDGVVPVEIGMVTIRDATGRVTGWQGIARDISQRKQLEQQLLQTERLRALGEMASGVAHDFNNILGAILGRAQLLRRAPQDEQIRRGLEAIEKAALDGASTVRRLQHFTKRRRDEEFFPVDLNQAIRDTLAITEAKWKDESDLAGATIEVVTEFGNISPVMGNISELREVLTNIIFNAVEAMPKGGMLTFRTEEVDGWVWLGVSDTGIGMSDEVKARIFDPFFTTKGVKGTGLGLSVSYGIVRAHHGDITVDSQPGQGTTMVISIPIAAKPAKPLEPQRVPPPTKRGRVLIIDDDAMVRELLADILQSAGHTVVQVSGGWEGIRLFRQARFDLVLTDLGMPECSGWEVAAAIKAITPKTPVALVTGWGITLDRTKLKAAGVDLVLNKPFQYLDVMTVVAEAMELREKM
jgi:PAS domain S-box-containing protein